jgi:hypothetical protein
MTRKVLSSPPAIDRELNPKEDPNAPAEIIFDMPGPEREREPLQELTHADVRACAKWDSLRLSAVYSTATMLTQRKLCLRGLIGARSSQPQGKISR